MSRSTRLAMPRAAALQRVTWVVLLMVFGTVAEATRISGAPPDSEVTAALFLLSDDGPSDGASDDACDCHRALRARAEWAKLSRMLKGQTELPGQVPTQHHLLQPWALPRTGLDGRVRMLRRISGRRLLRA